MKTAAIVFLSLASALWVSPQLLGQAASAAKNTAQGADFTGVWYPSTGGTLGAGTADNPGQQFVWLDAQGNRLKSLPYTPLALEKMKSEHPIGPNTTAVDSDDPDFHCFPAGVPRIYLFLYPMEIVHTPGRVLQIFEYGHNLRQIFTDGRGHAEDENPTWMGDSIGKWEGSTLVVDTVNQNDKTWFGYGGQPHSGDLRVTERISRPDHDSLVIDITMDDPKMYTVPLHTTKKYVLKPTWNIKEFVCEDNQVNFLEYEKQVAAPKK